MKPEKLVKEWMEEIGLDATALDMKARQCQFSVLDRFEMSLEWPEGAKDLFAVLDLMPAGQGDVRRHRLEKAMQLNVYGLRTQGAVLGWDELDDRIVLSYRLLVEGLDIVGLNAAVTNLIGLGAEMAQELDFGRESAEQAGASVAQALMP